MRRLALFIVVALALTAQAGSAAGSPSGTYDFRVQVGAVPPDGVTRPFSYTRYYPERLRVHRGQTILFETVERVDLHTVSFWPGGTAARPPVFRSNDGPEPIAVNEPVWLRSPCGGVGQAACRLDGSGEHLASGFTSLSETTWRVTVDLPEGSAIQFFCMVHPGMTGSIEVVDDDRKLPTQAELDDYTRQQVAADTEEAVEHRAMLDGQVLKRSEAGRDVWRVLVGASSPSGHVSIMTYMPRRLEGVRPGDAVEFVSSGVGHHSVTFPTALVGHKGVGTESRLSFAAIHPACDFDDIDGGLPGIPGPWAPFSPISCPAAFEIVLSPWLSSPNPAPGGFVATPATYHDSGMMWSDTMPEVYRGRPAGSGQYFPNRFVATFPLAGSFKYACTVHGAENMAGTIEVG